MHTITKRYIDGDLVDSHGRDRMDLTDPTDPTDPTDREPIGQVTPGEEEDAKKAILEPQAILE